MPVVFPSSRRAFARVRFRTKPAPELLVREESTQNSPSNKACNSAGETSARFPLANISKPLRPRFDRALHHLPEPRCAVLSRSSCDRALSSRNRAPLAPDCCSQAIRCALHTTPTTASRHPNQRPRPADSEPRCKTLYRRAPALPRARSYRRFEPFQLIKTVAFPFRPPGVRRNGFCHVWVAEQSTRLLLQR